VWAAGNPDLSKSTSEINVPLCYVQLRGQGLINLEQLCGIRSQQQQQVIDLNQDTNRDGVPDELLAIMRQFDQAMKTARSSQEYEAALQRLEKQLPYSDSVKRLQAQQRSVQQQLANVKTDSQAQTLYRQLDNIMQQMYKDSSYIKVQEAMGKVYSKLGNL
jgi:16S rRNA C967 or C1407 C5-methylase (RsmB/RsmF family)